jgi:hypothetical protein
MAAVSVVTADIDRTRAYLAGNGIPLAGDAGDRVVVEAAAGMGANFVFHTADREPFPQP